MNVRAFTFFITLKILYTFAGDVDPNPDNVSAVIDNIINEKENEELELPTVEHVKLIDPGKEITELKPEDIQEYLQNDEFSEKLLAHDGIPESVKRFFRSQRSQVPFMEAVVPSVKPKQDTKEIPVSNGQSQAATIKEILLGVSTSSVEKGDFNVIGSNSENSVITDENDDMDMLDRPRRRIKCAPKNVTSNDTEIPVVQIVNGTELLDHLGNKNDSSNVCAVVLFYAPWCVFSARVAPHFNALARAFPQLDVFAIDAAHFSKFGTVAVPNILVFHNAKAVARFNNSERILPNIASFVTNITGLSSNESVNIEESDYLGPLPSTPSNDPDYLLWISWIFLISFTFYMVTKSSTGQKIWDYLGNLGHIEHQHID